VSIVVVSMMIMPMMMVMRVFMGLMFVVPMVGSNVNMEMSSTWTWRLVRSCTV
jgi:uncharacterized protein (DUF697 family)